MKIFLSIAYLFAAMFSLATTAQATPLSTVIISDAYRGYNDHGYGDVISSASSKDFFDVDHLKVEFNPDHLVNVTVYTGFKEGDPQAGDLIPGTSRRSG